MVLLSEGYQLWGDWLLSQESPTCLPTQARCSKGSLPAYPLPRGWAPPSLRQEGPEGAQAVASTNGSSRFSECPVLEEGLSWTPVLEFPPLPPRQRRQRACLGHNIYLHQPPTGHQYRKLQGQRHRVTSLIHSLKTHPCLVHWLSFQSQPRPPAVQPEEAAPRPLTAHSSGLELFSLCYTEWGRESPW